MRRPIILLFVGALVCLAAFGIARSLSVPDLSGRWTIELHLDSVQLIPRRPSKRDVVGQISLSRAPTGPDAPWEVGIHQATHHGRADIPLEAFGFAAADSSVSPFGEQGPSATEWARMERTIVAAGRSDSVLLRTNPFTDHGGIVLDGRPHLGEIRGRWYIPGYVPIAWGTFTMRRAG